MAKAHRRHNPAAFVGGSSLRRLWHGSLHICWICDQQVARLSEASRDHVVPQVFGSTDRRVRLAHKRCNMARGPLSVAEVETIKAEHPNASPKTLRYLMLTLRGWNADASEEALRTALSTVCRCQTPLDEVHAEGCPIYQYGFSAARALLGVPDRKVSVDKSTEAG